MIESFSFSDETLNINSTSNYLLTMQAGFDGFTYIILDSGRNKFIAIKHEHFQISESNPDELSKKISSIIDSDDLLCCKFKNVRFIFKTQKVTLIPDTLFDKDNLSQLFHFNHPISEHETLHYNKLSEIDAINAFSIPFEIIETIYNRFANAKLFNQVTPFADYNIKKYKTKSNKQRMIVNIDNGFFDAIIIFSSSLQLYNNFNYNTEDECVYFIMYMIEQLNINPETVELFVSGIQKNSSLLLKMKKFIKNVTSEKQNDTFHYSYIFKNVPVYKFQNLININQCE